MATNSLPHFDIDSYYQIALTALEDIHCKVDRIYAVLSMLISWVAENCISASVEDKNIMIPIIFLIIDLTEEVKQLLPEV